ncbi:hypothetical protein RND71_000893 [Anisodus tanguticus]|uniref:Uncharacterized protein n=1 Tax=Anisodus tanguticus TaxID=243964 RepID=A0AAE1VVH1_9SOLA|nr:hypothetical protein RND71_000893 [Anisodus tanguticus]
MGGPLGFTGLLRSEAIAPQLGLGGLLGGSGRGVLPTTLAGPPQMEAKGLKLASQDLMEVEELHEVALTTSEDGGIRPSPGLGELPVAGGTKGRLSHGGGGPPCNLVHLAMEDHLNWDPKVPGMVGHGKACGGCYYLLCPSLLAALYAPKRHFHVRTPLCRVPLEMGLLAEAETTLSEPAGEVPNGAAGHYLLGLIYRYTDRRNSSIQHFNQALLLDPLLWSAYEELCILGAAQEASAVFGDASSLAFKNNTYTNPKMYKHLLMIRM